MTKTKIEILLYISWLCFPSYYNIGIKVIWKYINIYHIIIYIIYIIYVYIHICICIHIYIYIYMYVCIPIQHSSDIASLIASPNFLIVSQQQYRKYWFSDLTFKAWTSWVNGVHWCVVYSTRCHIHWRFDTR